MARFYGYSFYQKRQKMRKQLKHLKEITVNAGQFKDGRKNAASRKNPRYIYTEDDLGEGLLDVGVTANYLRRLRDQLESSSWYPMLKTQWG
jgi:hypothetical protein